MSTEVVHLLESVVGTRVVPSIMEAVMRGVKFTPNSLSCQSVSLVLALPPYGFSTPSFEFY